MPKSNTLIIPVLALTAALAALAVSIWRDGEGDGSLAPADDGAAAAAAGLIDRIDELEHGLTETRRKLDLARAELRSSEVRLASAQRESPAPDEWRHVEKALAKLGDEIGPLRERLERVEQRSELHQRPKRPVRPPRRPTAEWKRQAVDAASSEEQRLKALRHLRGRRLEDGSDARDADVVRAMIDVYRTSPSPAARADVFRQLHGVTDAALRDPLLEALADDPSEDVREEAAETLDAFVADPLVAEALRRAADQDSDRGVRRQALESLGDGEKRR